MFCRKQKILLPLDFLDIPAAPEDLEGQEQKMEDLGNPEVLHYLALPMPLADPSILL
jgi:hypothetical protein